MISQLGQGLVLLALLLCCLGAPLGFVAGARRSSRGLELVRRLSLGFAAAMVAANLLMWFALLRHDFSVSYVAQVGSLSTPTHITIFSLWSSLEGSILFWGLVLGLYTLAVTVLQRSGHEDYLAYTLGTILTVGLYFCFLIAGPANPFAPTAAPIPSDGPGPNPLLQNHILMAIHPPTLYLGYVGMTVPFAMAVAALLRGQLGPTWLRPLRNWLLVPTGFLTLGIMLGGWWSYEVLGWGGYWAWDPVENASFLPWLTAIAAVHSAVVQQRRGTLKAWTTILIMVSFLLTILGTFLTRSGVINSVHAFTESEIGPLFLSFLGACLIFVVILLSLRIDTLVGEPGELAGASREGAFLLNNLVLVGIMFTTLVGTLFPIAAELVRDKKVSLGEPYFNRMAVPLFLILILLMGVGPALPWGRANKKLLLRALVFPLPAASLGLALGALLGARSGPVLIACALAGYTLWVTFDQGLRPTRTLATKGTGPARSFLHSTLAAPRKLGGYIVHFGVVVTFLAIAISANYQEETEASLRPGDSASLGGYELRFEEPVVLEEDHVLKQGAKIVVVRDGDGVGELVPTLNQYPTRREPLGTPAVRTSLTHDLYLTLMNVHTDGSVGLRAILTPAVVWIWVGVFVMVAGTVLCLLPPMKLRVAEAIADGSEAPVDTANSAQPAARSSLEPTAPESF